MHRSCGRTFLNSVVDRGPSLREIANAQSIAAQKAILIFMQSRPRHTLLKSLCGERSTLDPASANLEYPLLLRDAAPDDADAIAAIYNHYVATSTISFEEEPVTVPAMRQRIADVQQSGLPWLVALVDGKVGAYAYATPWRVRAAYRFSVESTVYVDANQARSGLGSALYGRLMARLREAGLHLVVGGIALPNAASIALHEKMGFDKVAHFSEVGLKFGRWIDVGYWQLKL